MIILFYSIAEFERLLAVSTSVEATFLQNFLQASEGILSMAKKVRRKKPAVDNLLKLLEQEPEMNADIENSEGMYNLNQLVNFIFCSILYSIVLPHMLETRAKKTNYELVTIIKVQFHQ